MAWNFEFVLHFVRCNTVTVSLNQIIIIIIIIIMLVSQNWQFDYNSDLRVWIPNLCQSSIFYSLCLDCLGKHVTENKYCSMFVFCLFLGFAQIGSLSITITNTCFQIHHSIDFWCRFPYVGMPVEYYLLRSTRREVSRPSTAYDSSAWLGSSLATPMSSRSASQVRLT